MATINASKWGYSAAPNHKNHAAARGATAGNNSFTATDPTSNIDYAVSYQTSISRRSSTYTIARSFFYFDTHTITSTVSAASLNITGYSSTTADVIIVLSDAFGGDGGTAFDKYDFDNLTFGTPYSTKYTPWLTSNNAISFNTAARTAIENEDDFIIALIQYDNDYLDVSSSPSSVTRNSGIAWGTTPYLDYTVSAATDVTSVNTIVKSNITSYNTITAANIDELNTLTF